MPVVITMLMTARGLRVASFFKTQRRSCSCQCKPTWRRVRLLTQWNNNNSYLCVKTLQFIPWSQQYIFTFVFVFSFWCNIQCLLLSLYVFLDFLMSCFSDFLCILANWAGRRVPSTQKTNLQLHLIYYNNYILL
jgi:hypothetical protein